MSLTLRVLLITAGAIVAVILLAALRRPLAALLKLLARTGAGLGVLALLHAFGAPLGLTLGVNLWNALTIALLGAPGLGLLMMLHWITRL